MNSKDNSRLLYAISIVFQIGFIIIINIVLFLELGLYLDNELVSLMVFGENNEILRFCNKLNTNIVDSVEKLFTHFINKYKFTEIITYVDRCLSDGKLYEELGFKYIDNTEPNCFYVFKGKRNKNIDDKKLHRIYDCGDLVLKFKGE